MLIRRRGLLLTLPPLALWRVAALLTDSNDLKPGDFGYKHDQYHLHYQTVFGASGRCSCGTGDCRVTIWRPTKLGSKRSYDVLVDGQWWPLPENVYQPDPTTVPEELRTEAAHICAYGGGGGLPPTIPCAIINLNGT